MGPLSEGRSYLAATQLFESLTVADLERVMREWTLATVPAGRTFYRPYDQGDVLFLIRRGRVQLARRRNGAAQVEVVLGPGAVFGQMSLVGQTLNNLWATAVAESQLYTLSRAEVETLIRRRPLIALRILEQAGRQLVQAEAELKRKA